MKSPEPAPDAGETKYNDYHYARSGSPAEVRMPLEAGAYELRYVQWNKKVIARKDITVEPATATLDAPASAVAGTEIEVAFTGPPAHSGDFVTVTTPDASDTSYTDYHYSRSGSPAVIRMPAEPGDYELRFVQNNRKVLARRPIKVTPAP